MIMSHLDETDNVMRTKEEGPSRPTRLTWACTIFAYWITGITYPLHLFTYKLRYRLALTSLHLLLYLLVHT